MMGGLLVLSACVGGFGVRGGEGGPGIRYYTLALPQDEAPAGASTRRAPAEGVRPISGITLREARAGAAGAPLVVATPFDAAPELLDRRLQWRRTPWRVEYLEFHEWVGSPGEIVSVTAARYLEARGVARYLPMDAGLLAPPGVPAPPPDLYLVGVLHHFESVPSEEGGGRSARLALDCTLRNPAGAAVWRTTFDATTPLPSNDGEGLARALSDLLDRALAPAVAYLTGFPGTGEPAPRPPRAPPAASPAPSGPE